MTVGTEEKQLELFPLGKTASPPPRRESVGRVFVQLRYDQLILGSIGCLIGITVIFASGVERGKQLSRLEGLLLARHQVPVGPTAATEGASKKALVPTTVSEKLSPKSGAVLGQPKGKPPSKLALAGLSRYAIQVVTYSRPQLASQELQRLQSRGEQAFLIKRDGRTAVYIGPFPSQAHASKKLATLKTRYQDCFIKTL